MLLWKKKIFFERATQTMTPLFDTQYYRNDRLTIGCDSVTGVKLWRDNETKKGKKERKIRKIGIKVQRYEEIQKEREIHIQRERKRGIVRSGQFCISVEYGVRKL